MTRPDTDETITTLASRQHGVVSRRQLLATGVGVGAVEYRVRQGRLRRLHQGVYQVGPILQPLAHEMAAVLACGPHAVVGHRSAGILWKILPAVRARRKGPPTVDIIVTRGARARPGIRTRRIRTIRPSEVTRRKGLPVTTPSRTIYDLASTATPRRLEQVFAEALARKIATADELRSLIQDHPRGPGTPHLRALLDHGDPTRTRSVAEDRFLALVRKAQIPMPAVNKVVSGYQVDFHWRKERLIVETDGYAYHSSREAFEVDRRRDAVLAAAGLRVVRVTWRQMEDEPEAVLARLVRALTIATPGGGVRT